MRKLICSMLIAFLFCSVSMAAPSEEYEGMDGICCWYACEEARASGSWYCPAHKCNDCDANKYCYECEKDVITWRLGWAKVYFTHCGHNNYSPYCKKHACTKGDKCRNDEKCTIHGEKCSLQGCTNWVATTNIINWHGKDIAICAEHKCSVSGCVHYKFGIDSNKPAFRQVAKSDYCQLHVCYITTCGNAKGAASSACYYCNIHKCKTCDNVIYCPTHKLPFSQCYNKTNHTPSVYCQTCYDKNLKAGRSDVPATDATEITNDRYLTAEEREKLANDVKDHIDKNNTGLPKNPLDDSGVDMRNPEESFCDKCNKTLTRCNIHGDEYCEDCDKSCPTCKVADKNYQEANGSTINVPMRTSQPLSYEKLPNPFLFLKGVEDEATIKEVADIALTPIAQLVYALLLKVGIAICLVVMTIYGFMWITATPQKRADLKQSIAPVLTGLFILIAGIGPAAQIVDLVNNAFTTSTTTTALIDNTAGAIAGLVQTIGISVALIILLSTGVQFITASPNKRVEIRGRITNIIIGVAIIILTSTILNVVISQISSMK